MCGIFALKTNDNGYSVVVPSNFSSIFSASALVLAITP